MKNLSFIGDILCAAIGAAIFIAIPIIILEAGLPENELSEFRSSASYTAIIFGAGAIGAYAGYKSATLLKQTSAYLLIADLFLGLIYSIWS